MNATECERIFERIEEYKRSTEKYIQDIASLVGQINEGYVVDELNVIDEPNVVDEEQEVVRDEMIQEDLYEYEYEYEYEPYDYEPVETEEIFKFDEDDDLADFLMETFDLI